MTLTVHDKPDTGGGAHAAIPLLVVRTRVLRVPVDDLLGTILAALIDQEDKPLRSEEADPEAVLEVQSASSVSEAERLVIAMASGHSEVPDRQRIKVVRRADASAKLLELADLPPYPAPGSAIPDMPGYVVGTCEHRVAMSEWRAGFRTCERCQFGASA